MTRERLEEIMESTESDLNNVDGDNAFIGMQILSKYTNNILRGAEHDVIFGPDIERCIEMNITEEDVTELAKLNWMIDEWGGGFACFV